MAMNRRRILATIAARRHGDHLDPPPGDDLAARNPAGAVHRRRRQRAAGDPRDPAKKTIEIILHTPGELVLAASQITRALSDHDGRIVAVVPHYAMSGGTLIALAADEILLDRHAALEPVDPQLGQYPARSLVEVASMPGRHEDQTLLLADVGRKAIRQVTVTVQKLLEKHMDPARAKHVAELMPTGVWTHDHALMDLFPQPRGRQASVEYVPSPHVPRMPPGREATGGRR